MIYYVTGDKNKNALDDYNVELVNKDIKPQVSYEDMMKFIKKELRNIEISCLILDVSIMDFTEEKKVQAIVDTFLMLNPESKAVLLLNDRDENEQWIENDEQLVIRNNERMVQRVRDFLEKKDQSPSETETQPFDYIRLHQPICDQDEHLVTAKVDKRVKLEEKIEPNSKITKQKIIKQSMITKEELRKDTIRVGVKKQKGIAWAIEDIKTVDDYLTTHGPEASNQKIVNKKIAEFPIQASEAVQENVSPDALYGKTSIPIKVSEGIPLKKRVSHVQSIKTENVQVENEVNQSKFIELDPESSNADEAVSEGKKVKLRWSCSNIGIAVIGTERKVGTTWTAILLANYFSEKGAKVAYSEANNHLHLQSLAKEFSFGEEDGYYTSNSIHFYGDYAIDLSAGMNFIIYDMGFLGNDEGVIARRINSKLISHILIVSGIREYEQVALDELLGLLGGRELHLLFNYTEKDKVAKYAENHRNMAKTIINVPYMHQIDHAGEWPEEFIEQFQQYLNRIEG